jgi:hypothetical protein
VLEGEAETDCLPRLIANMLAIYWRNFAKVLQKFAKGAGVHPWMGEVPSA